MLRRLVAQLRKPVLRRLVAQLTKPVLRRLDAQLRKPVLRRLVAQHSYDQRRRAQHSPVVPVVSG